MNKTHEFEVMRNPCTVCAPLGATLAYAGVRRGMTILHGSQGCATYIRRYTISHFREPLDAASSSFTEETAVFGGSANLRAAFGNVVSEYAPECIGIATTCLAETIGEDAAAVRNAVLGLPEAAGTLVATVSSASYRCDQRQGFRAAVRSLVEASCPPRDKPENRPDPAAAIALFPTMVSPEDLRTLKGIFEAFHLPVTLVSDYSDTLDGGPWKSHRLLPEGGTSVSDLRMLGRASASIELGEAMDARYSGSQYLSGTHGVPSYPIGLPVGLEATDILTDLLSRLSGKPIPGNINAERERLLDSYADAHKLVFRKRVLLYGDADQTAALSRFLREIGAIPVLPGGAGRDFEDVEHFVSESIEREEKIDLMIGNSKGYKTSRVFGIPLVRLGFPVHDRFGGQRLRFLGYAGSQELLDRIVNALIERLQEESDVGYTYY